MIRCLRNWQGAEGVVVQKFSSETFRYPAESDPEKPLQDLFPHYSDPRFATEQTIFGGPEEGLSYEYDDRLRQWYGPDKMNAARAAAAESGHARYSANWIADLMSHLIGRDVRVKHVLSGCNRSNGYPYFVVGYVRADDVE